jgi:hypothetical protein
MSDRYNYKQDTPGAFDEIKGKPREHHGEPEDRRTKCQGDVSQSDSTASDSAQAQEEQERQLETGEENPG